MQTFFSAQLEYLHLLSCSILLHQSVSIYNSLSCNLNETKSIRKFNAFVVWHVCLTKQSILKYADHNEQTRFQFHEINNNEKNGNDKFAWHMWGILCGVVMFFVCLWRQKKWKQNAFMHFGAFSEKRKYLVNSFKHHGNVCVRVCVFCLINNMKRNVKHSRLNETLHTHTAVRIRFRRTTMCARAQLCVSVWLND